MSPSLQPWVASSQVLQLCGGPGSQLSRWGRFRFECKDRVHRREHGGRWFEVRTGPVSAVRTLKSERACPGRLQSQKPGRPKKI